MGPQIKSYVMKNVTEKNFIWRIIKKYSDVSVCLSVYLFVCLFVYMSVYLSVTSQKVFTLKQKMTFFSRTHQARRGRLCYWWTEWRGVQGWLLEDGQDFHRSAAWWQTQISHGSRVSGCPSYCQTDPLENCHLNVK